MTPLPATRNGHRQLLVELPFDDIDVSWAGPFLHDGSLCIGSEDGNLVFLNASRIRFGKLVLASPSGEAINGFAHAGKWLCISTRNEVTLCTMSEDKSKVVKRCVLPFGAHNVVSGPTGGFFAPLGRKGLLHLDPTDADSQPVTVSGGSAESFYFYEIASLPSPEGGVTIALAGRQGGIGTVVFDGNGSEKNLHTISYDGLDIVDVCALNLAGHPFAAAALGSEGDIFLFRDVRKGCDLACADSEFTPVAIRYANIHGTPYRLQAARGRLFLLTSTALYVISGLLGSFLDGSVSRVPTPMLEISMEAIDANLCGDQSLVIALPNSLKVLDLELLDQHPSCAIAYGQLQMQPDSFHPDFHRESHEQLMSSFSTTT